MNRLRHVSLLCLLLTLSSGCQKCSSTAKAPAMLKALPAGAQVLMQLDGKQLVEAYRKVFKIATKLLPEKERGDIPSWDEVVAKLKEPTGIDLNRVGTVLGAFYIDPQAGPDPRSAIIIGGLEAKSLKGKQSGEHQGKSLYVLEAAEDFFYVQLDPKHLVASNKAEMLKKVLDTHAGKGKNLQGESKMLGRLLGKDPDFDHIRFYLLSSDLPGMARAPFKVDGGGFFMSMSKGLSAVIIGDEAGLGQLKVMAEMGLMQVKSEMAAIPKDIPPDQKEIYGQTIKSAGEFLEGIKIEQDGKQLVMSYRGTQEPYFLAGLMAAVAIPAFVTYIRKSKASEMLENLDRCYKGAVDYHDKPRGLADGTTVSGIMPPAMPEPICPGDRTIETLDSESRLFDPKLFTKAGKGAVFQMIWMVLTEKSFACYHLTMDTPGGAPKDGQKFTCHAWTDLDDDDKAAHWTKAGVFHAEGGYFRGSHVWHDPEADDW
jgi:hypothetical protein